jgi:penicillin-binding protein 1A
MNSLQRAFDPLSGPTTPRNRRRNPFWRFRRFLFALALLIVGGIGAVLYAFGQTELPPDEIDSIAQTSFLCTAEVPADCGPENATVLLSTAGEDREVITYDQLPQSLIDAVVATEDQDFFGHQGIDPRGITRAAYQYLRKEGVVQGGSTITQQYVKLAFNDAERDLSRKAREAIRAIKLEQELARECSDRADLGERTPERCAKEEILTRYLNRAYFGRGASGVQAAARTYFDKDVGELDVPESAFLAGLLRNPNGADPARDPEEANRRRTTSLELMVKAEYLTLEEATAANEAPWYVVPARDREGLGEVKGAEWGSEYFVEEVRKQLDVLYPNGELYSNGIRVYTTLDQVLQQAAWRAAHEPKPDEDLEARGRPQLGPAFLDPNNPNDPAAAIVSLDDRGRVIAMLGGTNFENDEFNLATSSGGLGRQPGSTFKAIGLALAIEQGISAKSLYPAVPGVTRVGGMCSDADGPWQVTGGSSGQYRYRDLIDALKWSSNVVFAQLVVDIRPDLLAGLAKDLGVTSDLNQADTGTPPCSLILGSKEVPVIDMAGVYSVFERGGTQIDPVLIERIENVDGEVVCWYPIDGVCAEGPDRQGDQVIDPSTAHQVNYALVQNANEGTGRAAFWSEERPVAGKTGTSQNNVDGWFAGFSCGITTAVWVGHEGETQYPMIDFRKPRDDGGIGTPKDEQGRYIDDRDWPNIEGGNMPTWIWKAYMQQATAALPPCEPIEVESEFPGVRLNQELSVTTLPPCGVELDRFGYPYGSDPNSFRYLNPTTVPEDSTTSSSDSTQPTDSTQPPSTRPPDTRPPATTQPPPTTQPPTTDAPTTTEAPAGAPPPPETSSTVLSPDGPPPPNSVFYRNNNEDNGNNGSVQQPPEETTSTTAPCVPPEMWNLQGNPAAPQPTAKPEDG